MNAEQTATFTAEPTGGTAPFRYRWYSCASFTCATSTPISGETNNTYNPPTTATGTSYYKAVIVDATAATTTTNVATLSVSSGVLILSESFDNINTLLSSGWSLQNKSNPLGIRNWFQGNPSVFPAQSGLNDAYIGSNYNNTAGTGTISNWLLTPELSLINGTTLRFWTRTVSQVYPDRLQIRLSTNGSSTNVGNTDTSVGDFTTLLLTINSALTTTGYPIVWTEYTVIVSGLGTSTTGRFAFRYFVTNGGPSGANSDYIGIDTVSVTSP